MNNIKTISASHFSLAISLSFFTAKSFSFSKWFRRSSICWTNLRPTLSSASKTSPYKYLMQLRDQSSSWEKQHWTAFLQKSVSNYFKLFPEPCLEPCQTSKMELFAKIVNGWMDVWQVLNTPLKLRIPTL